LPWDPIYCLKYDEIKFDPNNIKIDKSNFDNTWKADSLVKNIKIEFPLKKESDDSHLDINDSTHWIKKINFEFYIEDKTKLDQYNKPFNTGIWASAVEILNTTNDDFSVVWKPEIRKIIYTLSGSSEIWNFLNSGKDAFLFPYKFYNSTTKLYGDSTTEFNIKTIKYDFETMWWKIQSSSFLFDNITEIDEISIPVKIKPLYETKITWSLSNSWFVVWTTQSWDIKIINDNLLLSWSLRKLYVEYWKYETSIHKNIDELKMETFNPNLNIWEWYNNKTLFKNNFSTWTINLKTRLTQSWTIDSEQHSYFSTHISFILWWKNVIHNWDIVWMTAYWWTPDWNNTSQQWVKIFWKTHSKKQVDLITNQNKENIHTLWEIEKSSKKRDIRKKAFDIIKLAKINNWTKEINRINWNNWNNNIDWTKLLWSNILYFWDLNWSNVELDSSDKFEWKKTIIINWWNLYIKTNIVNNSSSDILWVIVLKDKNNKWWNIYIDPEVKKIDAVIYSDKSLLSYNTTYCPSWEISPNCGWTLEVLNKQLYIYGSVFSENTIWGSVNINNLICPYYIDESSCNLDTASKYDMNYIRRLWNEKYDPSYPDYPVVIKYNSLLQINPPPVFDN
jgi:hypothetical protein